MYHVPYLRFAARFPICSFPSGTKCWYGDRLDVTVVTSHVTTTYNFAKKTFTNWLQTVKFAKVFSLESFLLYGIHQVSYGIISVYHVNTQYHLQLVSPISNTHQALNVYLVEQYAKLGLFTRIFFPPMSITSCHLFYFRTACKRQTAGGVSLGTKLWSTNNLPY